MENILLPKVIIFFQIVFIDIVMAADNAIIIGLIAANFAPDNPIQSSGISKKPGNSQTISEIQETQNHLRTIRTDVNIR